MIDSCGSPCVSFLHVNISSADEIDAACGVALRLCAFVEPVGFHNERAGVPLKVRHPVELCG